MKSNNWLKISFDEEMSNLLKDTFSNLKEYSWKDLSCLKNIISGDISIKIPFIINIPEEKKPKYKNAFSMLILKNMGQYSRKKVPSFFCKDMNFDEVTLWSFNLSKGRMPLFFSEVSSFQSSTQTYLKQEAETIYFEDSLSFPFVNRNKKDYQAIHLAIFLFLNEFYFENNPLLSSLNSLKKKRYSNLFENIDYIDKLLFLNKFMREETQIINKKIFNKNKNLEYMQKKPSANNKKSIFSFKISKNLQFFRDFDIKFYEKNGKIIAKVFFLDNSELLFFKSKKIIDNKIFEILFQYILYGKLVKEINNIFCTK